MAAIRASASSTSRGTARALGPGQAAVGALTLLEHVPAADAVALDPEREIGLEADRLPGAGRVGRVAAVVDERPLGGRPAVVERGLADELDLDLALEALDRPHEHVVARRRRPEAACAA